MHYDNLIGGRWTGKHYKTNINPSNTDDEIGSFASADTAETNQAIDAASEAKPSWRNFPSGERTALLRKIGNTILATKDDLGRTLSREEGKILPEGVGEATRAGNTFLYYAAQIENAQGEVFTSSRAHTTIQSIRRPVGAVGIITPWNFPLAVPAWKIAPALAYGNTVVFKPAELVPSSAWALADIISNAGIPEGVFNLVMGSGSVVGETMGRSTGLDAISFTGSNSIGLALARSCIQHGPKRIQTEMGGKNSLIVLDDANLETATEAAVDGAYISGGQRCTATSRIIATPGIYDELVERIAARIRTLRVGDAHDPSSDIGPLASRAQFDQVGNYLRIGIAEGAELVIGGDEIPQSTPGYYRQPALFAGGRSEMRINQEEIFGPVACVLAVADLDEAIAVSNDTTYGLSAGIITDSQRSITKFLDSVDAGLLHVNRSTASTELHVPFGGNKSSSFGPREQGTSAREFYTSVSSAYLTTVPA